MAELVIAGAGPQALTLCCQLLQKRPQWRRQLRVLDPTGTWLSCWHSQMRRYEIPWLRSPSSHHPHPNPHALRRYAQERQRSLDLEGPYGLPHTSLFADFCRSVVADFQLGSHVQAASVQQIRLDQAGPASLEVTLSDGAVVAAHRLVIATGAGVPVLPSWARTIAAPHPAEAMQHSQSIDLAACQGLRGQHILIVGGGLTSGHLALGAIKRGPGSPCCAGGTCGANTSTQIRAGWARTTSRLFVLNRAGTGAASRCWKLAMAVRSRPSSLPSCIRRASRAACNSMSTVRWRKLAGVQASGRFFAAMEVGSWPIASGWPPASTRESATTRCCASYWSNVPSS